MAEIEQPIDSGTAAPQNNGSAGLDDLLAEYAATVGTRSDAGGNSDNENGGGSSVNGNGGDVHGAADGPTLDDLINQDSAYWQSREQAAFAQRVTEEARTYLDQATKARDDADTEALLKEVRGDHDPVMYSDKAVRAFIIGEAIENPALYEIFQQRQNNPRAYEGLRRQLAREFHKVANSRPDADLTEDRNLVAAAVRGASTTRAPEDPPRRYGNQSNNDFRQSVLQDFGFDPMH